ncbi:MAG: O-antigen ligase family protein [Verrucomicrobiota bacterium]|jgi:O-antigen ligase
MKPEPKPAPPDGWLPRLFVTLFGAFLGLTLLKFGNPPNMESFVSAPTDVWEFFFVSPWPIPWAYCLLGLAALLGLMTARWKLNAPLWLVALPLAWLIWQFLAASYSLEPHASRAIVVHFAACVVCFYLGLFSLGTARSLASFWLGISVAFLFVLALGGEQHFGGLADTRRYFYANIYPTLKSPMPPEYFKKLNSTRIFSTLFYPNTLAGALLLLLPPVLMAVTGIRRLTIPARAFLVTVIALAALACLCWSGSKAGWLLMLLLGIVALLRLPFDKRFRIALVAGVLFLGLIGFFWQFAAFLKRGAPSASARLDYWEAAARIARAHPLLGSGPGTFGSSYLAIKRPESEPARLTHNDYLEQASDSGLPGFVAYSAFVLGALLWSAPNRPPGLRPRQAPAVSGGLAAFLKPLSSAATHIGITASASPALAQDRWRFAVWLGVLGWSLQGLFEFGLYIPALAWPAFTFIGWLLGSQQPGSGPGVRPSTNPGSFSRLPPHNANPLSKRP